MAWRWFLRMWPMSWWRWTCSERGALLICQDHRVCELRKHFSFLFSPFFEDFSAAQPNPFCCGNWSTTDLFMISFLSRTIDFLFSFWAYGFICGWLRLVSSRSAKQSGWRSPPIVIIVTINDSPRKLPARWKVEKEVPNFQKQKYKERRIRRQC